MMVEENGDASIADVIAMMECEEITNGEDKDDLMLQILVVEEEWFGKLANGGKKMNVAKKEKEVTYEHFDFIFYYSSIVRVEEDVVIEDKVAVAEFCVDVACLFIEIVEDVACGNWWRWSVCGGMDPKKDKRRGERIWRRMVQQGERRVVKRVVGGEL